MTGFALHLLRHGAPKVAGRMLGHSDMASTPEGIAACAAQAETLKIEAIVTSDLSRAAAAAEAIGAAQSVPVRPDPRWRELDFGAWDGLAGSEIGEEALGRFWADPDAFPPPDGERWSSLVARVSSAVTDLAPRPTLVVTHGGAMRAALAVLCGCEHRQLWAFALPYAGLLSLQVWPGTPRSAQIVGLRA